MTFANTNDYLTGRDPVVTTDSVEHQSTRFEINLTTGDLTLNNLGEIGVLPAGYEPVALIIDATKMDTGATPTLAFEVGLIDPATGLLSTKAADGGAPWATGVTVGQQGGQAPAYSLALANTVQDPEYDRNIGVQITAAPATAAAGTLGVRVIYKAASR